MKRSSYFLVVVFLLFACTSLFAQISFTKHLLDGNFARANGVVSVDLDGDGDMDILGSAIDANTVAWWENSGSQSFAKHIIDGNFSGAISVEAVDADGDGDIDVSAAAFGGNTTTWWKNDGNQNFAKLIIDATVETSVYPKDVDGDGDMDFLGASFNDNSLNWYANDGNENFTKHQIEGNYLSPFDAFPTDLDGDGDIDLVASSSDGNTIDWCENNGSENFTKHNIANSLNGPRHLYVVDIDSDNDLDVLGTQAPGHDFSWWENDGSQSFTKHLLDNSIGAAFDIHSVDLDNDGDMDIIGASIGPTGILVVWVNDGNENFAKTEIDGNFPGANCVVTADVDGDGALDILATAEFGNGQIAWYENSLVTSGKWRIQNSELPTDEIIVLSAVNEKVCWGVTRATGGHYITRTINGGATWIESNPVSLSPFSSIEAVSSDTAWVTSFAGIYKTTNGGINWNHQLSTELMMIVRFFNNNDGVCIGDGIGGNAEVYTTNDGGNNWIPVLSSNIPTLVSEGFIPANSWVVGNTIWAPTNGGSLYKSTNKGQTWESTRNVVNVGGSYCAFKDSLNGLLSGSLAGVVKRTTDGGATWTPTESIPKGMSTLFMVYIPGTSGSYIITAAPPHGPIPGSSYTLDNGATWISVDNFIHGKATFVSSSVGWSWGGANIIYKWSGSDLVVPVELTSFTVQARDQTVVLSWVTATELNNHGFEIQRRVIDGDFTTVGFIEGEGTTTNQKEYSYTDKILAEGKYFYRLKQIDFNGEYEYSKTIEVEVRSLNSFALEQNYPNPFNPATTIGYVLQENSNTKLTLINSIGEAVAILVNEVQDKGYHKLDLNAANLPSGVYFYKLVANEFVSTRKMLLVK